MASNACLGCGLKVDENGLPYVAVGPGLSCIGDEIVPDLGCGLGIDGSGNMFWNRGALFDSVPFPGYVTVNPPNRPTETQLYTQSLSLTNTSCGPMACTYKVNLTSKGAQIVPGNNWFLRDYVSINGGPTTGIGQARWAQLPGGVLAVDFPTQEWHIVQPVAAGATASITYSVTFQTPTYTASPNNLISSPGGTMSLVMLPLGV